MTPDAGFLAIGSPASERDAAAMSTDTQTLPPQTQDKQPGREAKMHPRPAYEPRYPDSGRLKARSR